MTTRYVQRGNEGQHQEALFDWANHLIYKYPELKYLYHIPNGGKRDARTAIILKREGVKAGIPDICLPVSRKGYHGLYIELKVGKNKPTEKQKKWIEILNQQGYFATWCTGWTDAAKIIQAYLDSENKGKEVLE